jgi:hypothetical protein
VGADAGFVSASGRGSVTHRDWGSAGAATAAGACASGSGACLSGAAPGGADSTVASRALAGVAFAIGFAAVFLTAAARGGLGTGAAVGLAFAFGVDAGMPGVAGAMSCFG